MARTQPDRGTDPEFDTARDVLAAVPADELGALLAVADNELKAEGRHASEARALIIRAADIATRPGQAA